MIIDSPENEANVEKKNPDIAPMAMLNYITALHVPVFAGSRKNPKSPDFGCHILEFFRFFSIMWQQVIQIQDVIFIVFRYLPEYIAKPFPGVTSFCPNKCLKVGSISDPIDKNTAALAGFAPHWWILMIIKSMPLISNQLFYHKKPGLG